VVTDAGLHSDQDGVYRSGEARPDRSSSGHHRTSITNPMNLYLAHGAVHFEAPRVSIIIETLEQRAGTAGSNGPALLWHTMDWEYHSDNRSLTVVRDFHSPTPKIRRVVRESGEHHHTTRKLHCS
jgi:hypothetical protein